MLPVSECVLPTDAIKEALAARDYLEVVTFSFVDRQLETDFAGESNPIALLNPIASQMSVMRSTLLGSLVECVRFNVARKQDRVRVFEIAACFGRADGGFGQTERLAGLCYGSARLEQWGERLRAVDFFDVRSDVEAIAAQDDIRFEPAAHPAFHPGQCARVFVAGTVAGWIGALHPALLQRYELPGATVGFELDLHPIRTRRLPAYRALSRFQFVRRDIALMVDDAVPAQVLQASIFEAGQPLVRLVTLFDMYAGEGVPKGRKSLAFRVLLQDTEKTLTDAEVELQIQRVVMVLQEKHGAVLRS
jgi:phenylalanyl-tRNA synthetase beta chain